MKIIQSIFCFLLATFLCGFGCSSSKPTPDPLADFHFSSLNNLHSNKAIMDDCQDYIQKLSPEEKKYADSTDFFEDGRGQHAIVIEVDLKPNAWNHVLIYDKDNKRIKVIKYTDRQFRS